MSLGLCMPFGMLLPLLVLLASAAGSAAVGTSGPTPGQGIYICSPDDEDPCPISLGPGQILTEGYAVYDNIDNRFGLAALTLQTDCNLVLYSIAAWRLAGETPATAVWESGTSGASGPCTLIMQLDGNLVLYDVHGRPIFYSATYNNPNVNATLFVNSYTFCVQPASEGHVCGSAATNSPLPLYQAPMPPAIVGTLHAGQVLTQGANLFAQGNPNPPPGAPASIAGSAYLVVQGDGNLVFYNTEAVGEFGESAASAIWNSGTFVGPAPFQLIMQEDCNLVLYNANGITAADAVWNSNTATGDPKCRLIVQPLTTSSASDVNLIQVINGNGQTVFSAPQAPYNPPGGPPFYYPGG